LCVFFSSFLSLFRFFFFHYCCPTFLHPLPRMSHRQVVASLSILVLPTNRPCQRGAAVGRVRRASLFPLCDRSLIKPLRHQRGPQDQMWGRAKRGAGDDMRICPLRCERRGYCAI
jgi:hypothetical protein